MESGVVMHDRYYAGAYWVPRRETALECAQRADLFFTLLARCDLSFAQWYRSGRGFPRELPGHPVRPGIEEWDKLLSLIRIRTDGHKKVIEDLGFNNTFWNAKKESTNILLHCGDYSSVGRISNSCILMPPTAGGVHERLLRVSVLADVITSMATAWHPDFAMVTSSEMVDLVEKNRDEVRVGWLTYLSRRLGTVPPLPAPVRVEPVGTLGSLLILSPEPMTASHPEHVALTSQVREVLDHAGLLRLPEAPSTPHP